MLEIFVFFSVFIFPLFLFHAPVVFENIGLGFKKKDSYN